jgi:glucokinase
LLLIPVHSAFYFLFCRGRFSWFGFGVYSGLSAETEIEMTTVLAGDIGATTTRLAYFEVEDSEFTLKVSELYSSRKAASLTEIVEQFLEEHGRLASRACFAVAGWVRDGHVQPPNLSWTADAEELSRDLEIPEVRLINDMQANAMGIAALRPEELTVLNEGTPDPTGTIALVSAGTGLGEAVAMFDGTRYRPLSSEGGHADFAPRDELETELLLYLHSQFGHVSTERVLSGPGLYNIYKFMRDIKKQSETSVVIEALRDGDPSAVIARAGIEGDSPLCSRVLDMFVSLYGAEAGNVALRYFAVGGVYLGGGIAPKIIERLKKPGFMLSFMNKGRLSPLLESIPVRVILNDQTALLGAGCAAALG